MRTGQMEIIFKIPVSKGFSGDEKYRVRLSDGRECLMRLSEKAQLHRKKAEFELMKTAFEQGVPVSEPYGFGEYEGKIYQLTEWLNGPDLETLDLSGEEGYLLGRKAAELLKKLHAIPAPADAAPWSERFGRKILVRAEEAAELFGENEPIALLCRCLTVNIGILKELGQCFSHGDYNPGNLILLRDGSLAAVDFNAYNEGYGEPVFEASVILSDKTLPESFRRGFRDGYFGEDVPERLLEYYRGYGLLAEVCEAEEHLQAGIIESITQFIIEQGDSEI